MIPSIVALFPSTVFPEPVATGCAALVGGPLKPLQCVYYAFLLTMLPVGVKITMKIVAGASAPPADQIDANVDPRAGDRKRVATDPTYARVSAIESHMYEAVGFTGLALAVLVALQAGVSEGAVAIYATSYLVSKAAWMAFYMASLPQFVGKGFAGVFGVARTCSFLASEACVATLLQLAAR